MGGALSAGTGLELATDAVGAWDSALRSSGWTQSGTSAQFTFQPSETSSGHSKPGVLAFQKLWNVNNPDDHIAEDGIYGPQTNARLQNTPCSGFPQYVNPC